MRYFYTFLFYLFLPIILVRLLWRSRRSVQYRRRWSERFGFAPPLSKCIWVHAVSVGETLAALPLIKALKKNYPDIPILVTNMTPTGAARVRAALGDSVLQSYVPYDLPDIMARFLNRTRPLMAIIMETEMWPNLFASCKKRNIPLFILNARMSAKSARGYSLISPLTREMFEAVKMIAAQSDDDAKRFLELGLSKEKITVTGNLKFDVEIPADLSSKKTILQEQFHPNAKIWIAASTHPTEEEIVLKAHQLIREKNPQAVLILVPRHPERFDSIAALSKQFGFATIRRSKNENAKDAEVYLADTMGEMLLMYAVADVAFVAGSFAPVGGHNMLEAAVLGKPIIMGPQLYNFSEASRLLLEAKGMYVVTDANQLAEAVLKLFNDENHRKVTGENARQVVEANRGALKKQLNLVEL